MITMVTKPFRFEKKFPSIGHQQTECFLPEQVIG
jgi:hypothetical protein